MNLSKNLNAPYHRTQVPFLQDSKLETSSAIQPRRDHPSGIQLRGKFFESFPAKISPYISCELGQQNQMAKISPHIASIYILSVSKNVNIFHAKLPYSLPNLLTKEGMSKAV